MIYTRTGPDQVSQTRPILARAANPVSPQEVRVSDLQMRTAMALRASTSRWRWGCGDSSSGRRTAACGMMPSCPDLRVHIAEQDPDQAIHSVDDFATQLSLIAA